MLTGEKHACTLAHALTSESSQQSLCVQESGRYHIYVGNACPWCHRVLIAIVLRGLQDHVSLTFAADDPERASRGGWVFDTPEPIFGATDLRCVVPIFECMTNVLSFSGV